MNLPNLRIIYSSRAFLPPNFVLFIDDGRPFQPKGNYFCCSWSIVVRRKMYRQDMIYFYPFASAYISWMGWVYCYVFRQPLFISSFYSILQSHNLHTTCLFLELYGLRQFHRCLARSWSEIWRPSYLWICHWYRCQMLSTLYLHFTPHYAHSTPYWHTSHHWLKCGVSHRTCPFSLGCST